MWGGVRVWSARLTRSNCLVYCIYFSSSAQTLVGKRENGDRDLTYLQLQLACYKGGLSGSSNHMYILWGKIHTSYMLRWELNMSPPLKNSFTSHVQTKPRPVVGSSSVCHQIMPLSSVRKSHDVMVWVYRHLRTKTFCFLLTVFPGLFNNRAMLLTNSL